MTGCWERNTKPFLTIGLVHQWNIHPDFLLAMLRMAKLPPGKTALVNYDFQHDKPWDMARNQIAKDMLDDGSEWLFMLDSDVLPPPNVIPQLMSSGLPIVSGLYYRRHPEIFPEAFKLVAEDQFAPVNPATFVGGLNEVDGVGSGCLLIHRRVFESLKDEVPKLRIGRVKALTPKGEDKGDEKLQEGLPTLYEFFKWSVFTKPWVSEDLYFMWLLRKKGWRVYVDTTVSCGHVISSGMFKDGQFAWTDLEVPKR